MVNHTKRDDPWAVSRPAENKIIYKLAFVGEAMCGDLIKAYNECMGGRTVTGLVLCKDLYKQSDACMMKYVNEKNKEALRRKWILAGRPRWPDWKEMLTGVVPQEAIDKVYGEGEQQEQ